MWKTSSEEAHDFKEALLKIFSSEWHLRNNRVCMPDGIRTISIICCSLQEVQRVKTVWTMMLAAKYCQILVEETHWDVVNREKICKLKSKMCHLYFQNLRGFKRQLLIGTDEGYLNMSSLLFQVGCTREKQRLEIIFFYCKAFTALMFTLI